MLSFLLAPFRALAALAATVWAFAHWRSDPTASTGWFFCRLAATSGRRCGGGQCHVCAEDQARMRTRALGMVPRSRWAPRRQLTLAVAATLLLLAVLGLGYVAHLAALTD